MWERNGDFDVEWNPLSLKTFIDKWISEGVDNREGGWEPRKSSPLIRVWTRWNGTKALPSMPMIRVEHYFPDVDDPMIVHLAMNEYRHEWDSEALTITDMEEYSNHCTYAKDIILKPVFKTNSR